MHPFKSLLAFFEQILIFFLIWVILEVFGGFGGPEKGVWTSFRGWCNKNPWRAGPWASKNSIREMCSSGALWGLFCNPIVAFPSVFFTKFVVFGPKWAKKMSKKFWSHFFLVCYIFFTFFGIFGDFFTQKWIFSLLKPFISHFGYIMAPKRGLGGSKNSRQLGNVSWVHKLKFRLYNSICVWKSHRSFFLNIHDWTSMKHLQLLNYSLKQIGRL